MEQAKINWSSFRKRITIRVSADKIYNAWTTQSAIQQWFLEKADYTEKTGMPRKPDECFQKGDQFIWKWNNWDFEEKGTILEANGKDSLSFTFGSGGNVHVKLKESDNRTEVILIQENIPTDEKSKQQIYTGCATGWTFWLANLKAWLEYGITLHATGLSQDETDDLVNS